MNVARLAMIAVLACVAAPIALVAAGWALWRPNGWWATGWLSLALVVVALSAIGALFGRGWLRAAAGGAAICGGLYLLLIYGPGLRDNVGPELITSKALAWLGARLHPDQQTTPSSVGWTSYPSVTYYDPSGSLIYTNSNFSGTGAYVLGGGQPAPAPLPAMWQIGHAVWALLAAVVGAVFAVLLDLRRRRQPSPDTVATVTATAPVSATPRPAAPDQPSR
jgi:hypothetical protein